MVKAEQAKTVKSKKASLVKLNKLALPSLYHYVIKQHALINFITQNTKVKHSNITTICNDD
jgi:hypothetical protein